MLLRVKSMVDSIVNQPGLIGQYIDYTLRKRDTKMVSFSIRDCVIGRGIRALPNEISFCVTK